MSLRARFRREEDRGAWSALGAVISAAFLGGAIAWWVAIAPSSSSIPEWPAFAFVALFLAFGYLAAAPLMGSWPWTVPVPGPKPLGGSNTMALVAASSRYLDTLEERIVSSLPRRRASAALRASALAVQASAPEASELAMALAGERDVEKARGLAERLAAVLGRRP